MIVAGYPVSWWVRPPVMPRWITIVHVRLGFIGALLFSPLVLMIVTFIFTIWLAKLAVLLIALFVMAIVELANAYEAWTLRHADDEPEGKVG